MKLSKRAKIVLSVIREACEPARKGYPGCYFVPNAHPVYSEMFPADSIQIGGSGDARIIKSLIANGLAKSMPVADYACQITEDGLLAYEALRDDQDAIDDQDRKRAERSRLDAEFSIS